MDNKVILTQEGLKKLEEELEDLKVNKPGINAKKKTPKPNTTIKNESKKEDVIKALNYINSLLNRLPNLAGAQKEIFVFLSDKGLEKLTEMTRGDDIEIRKLAFLCLVNMLYKNEVLINIFCEKYGFNAVGNVICINWLPKLLDEKMSFSPEVLQDIQESSENFNQSTKYWKWPNDPKFTDSIVPDPDKYLLGFIHKENDIFMNSNPMKPNISNVKREGLSKYEESAIEVIEKFGKEE